MLVKQSLYALCTLGFLWASSGLVSAQTGGKGATQQPLAVPGASGLGTTNQFNAQRGVNSNTYLRNALPNTPDGMKVRTPQ